MVINVCHTDSLERKAKEEAEAAEEDKKSDDQDDSGVESPNASKERALRKDLPKNDVTKPTSHSVNSKEVTSKPPLAKKPETKADVPVKGKITPPQPVVQGES